MKVRRYKPTDYEMVSSWLKAREKDLLPESRLPKVGFIVEHVACAFLIKTNAKIAFIEYFVSNPQVLESLRIDAYDLIFPALEKAALKSGCEVLMATTDILKVAVLGIRAGMIKDSQFYFMLRKPLMRKEEKDGRGSESGAGVSEHPSP